MILHALKEYYDRKAALPDDASGDAIAPPGWEKKELPFLIVLDAQGNPIAIDDTRELVGKKKRAKTFLVPQTVKRTVGIAANVLWDNPEYVFGVVTKGKPERVAAQHAAFIEQIALLNISNEPEIATLLTFLGRSEKSAELEACNKELWTEILETAPFLSFKIAGAAEPIFRNPAVVRALASQTSAGESNAKALCLVTGIPDEIERLHPAIKGVRDANSTGANIVGFNLDAFCSYNKNQGENAPVGKVAAFAYTTALNTLLGKDSKQKLQIGDASTIFWAAKDDTFEADVVDFFGEPPKDDPDRLVDAVKGLYQSAETGAFVTDSDETKFYVLGLAPNSARLSVRIWHCGTVAEMAGCFRQYFDELRIVHGPKDKDHLSLWRLLVSLAALGKSENIPPNLAGDIMRAILEGLPYPSTLLQSALLRLRAEQEVTYPRAALIKAFINRSLRLNNLNKEKELTVSLDLENTNTGYRLGRLFAVLERTQERANPGINATIRDRFYAAASSTPASVFGSLMRLKNHHLSKLENIGERVNIEKLFGEIISGVADFPAHLSLENQGRFAIGYYHQRQDFFTKKSDKE